jgi:hypothetical protein
LYLSYDFQDEFIIDELIDVIQTTTKNNPCDLVMEKSRDMGATWMVLMVLFWYWLFYSHSTFGLVSRIDEAIDEPNDPDTLMWKLDFLLEYLPWFLKPKLGRDDRAKKRFGNSENKASIRGYAATANVGTGGRKKVFAMDEFGKFKSGDDRDALASTQSIAPCRIIFSTPVGAGNAFAEMANGDKSRIRKATLHWTLHPDKSAGLYHSYRDPGTKQWHIEKLDPGYEYPEDYEFITDGKARSPWYDAECDRMYVERLISQELDIDYEGSGGQFFNAKILRECRATCHGYKHRKRS